MCIEADTREVKARIRHDIVDIILMTIPEPCNKHSSSIISEVSLKSKKIVAK